MTGRRVLTLTSLYPPSVGGAPSVVRRLVSTLQHAGDDVEVVVFGALGGDTLAAERAHDAAHPGTVHRVPAVTMEGRSILAMTGRVIRLTTAARWRRRPFDVVLCGVAYPCTSMAQLVRFLHATPVIAYAHGEDISVVGRGSPRMSAFKTWLLRRSLGRADVVFANSRATVDKMRDIGYHGANVEVLPPTIDPARFGAVRDEDVDAMRHRLGLDDARVLLTIARLTHARKGHDVVVRALAHIAPRHPDVHYVIVGQGDGTALRELADQHGVSDRVTILAGLPDEELAVVMRLAEIYVMPSRWDEILHEGEGFGIVYLEAAAAGRPAVAGSTGGAAEAVVDEVTGLLVRPESDLEVAEALGRLLDDPQLAARLGAAGQMRAATFAHDAVMPRLVAAAETASARRGRLRRQSARRTRTQSASITDQLSS